MNRKILIIIFIMILIQITIFSNIINFLSPKNVFNSPDESSNFLVTREYGSKGHFYLEEKYSSLDYGNNLHPRGFLSIENKIVPFSFLGLPLVYGPIFKFLEGYARILNLFLIIILYFYLIKITDDLTGTSRFNTPLVGILIISIVPIIYWFNYIYINTLGASVFFIVAFYYLLRFNKEKDSLPLFLSVLFSLISILFRYDYLLFLFLLWILTFSRKNLSRILEKENILIILLIFIIFFLAPLLILNSNLYGSPFKYGYSLFNQINFPQERSGSFLISILNILFPALQFNIPLLLKNFAFYFLYLIPIPASICFLGLASNKNFKKIGRYWILIFYILIYLGMSNTFGSGISNVSNHSAITRYWFLLYISLIAPSIYYIKKQIINGRKTITIILIFLLIMPNAILVYDLQKSSSNINKYSLEASEISAIPGEKYILSSSSDKFLFDSGHQITWWCGVDCEEHFNPEKLNMIIKELLKNNETVYLKKADLLSDERIALILKDDLKINPLPNNPGYYLFKIKNETSN